MNNYKKYQLHLIKLADVNYASAVLQWDQETYMPKEGAVRRGQQLSTLAGISHEIGTDESFGKLLLDLQQENLNAHDRRNVELSLKDYQIRKKYNAEFVKKLTQTISEAFSAWQEAKQKNDYAIYAPKLAQIIELKKQEAELLGYQNHPYDAMIDQYEPDTTTADIDLLFKDVKLKLMPFVQQVLQQQNEDDSFMYLKYPKELQWGFGMNLLEQMGYNFNAGRQDHSEHPFTIHFHSNDVRVTTRVDENNLHEMIWSTIHEGGHALYEQGILAEEYGLPLGEACSLAIHESQSRLWENNVGRSERYWKANYKALQALFPQNLEKISSWSFYQAMNRVQPGLIRTNADELTYHLHILIRFEIEKLLLNAELSVKDLPEFWNSKYREYLGVKVPNDSQGVLQDIHWSHGSLGYFPTYSLGSFYAAQFFAQAQKEIVDLNSMIESGNLLPLRNWLKEKVHVHGRFYNAADLIKNITGSEPDLSYFLNYAKEKYQKIYPGLSKSN